VSTGGDEQLSVACCIAGGGPAGMMLGLLLARAGVGVIVLEKHGDFLRDFRGDTIHPSTLEVMHELGLLERFLQLPYQKIERLGVSIGDELLPVADFTHLPTRCRFVALMPQWHFLDFLAREAAHIPTFALRMRTEVTDLIHESGDIVGVRARGPDGAVTIRAQLVIGADGRTSLVRERAKLPVDDFGAPMDVLWFRLSRRATDEVETMGRVVPGRFIVMIDRGDYWQCGFVIPKGTIERLRAAGLDAFRADVASAVRFTADRIHEITSWDDVKLLTVQVNRARLWSRPGLLCIGDAAHAMSPVGGVGINLAIQDAVAAANLLAAPLRAGRVTPRDLAGVQRRREWPTRVTQRLQMLAQEGVLRPVLDRTAPITPPLALRLLGRFPLLQRLPARLVGLGVRPEHVAPGQLAPAHAAGR
jgi:2-polyprenyl-6-methoxyphenol hydroxylase-like FAD-dependent oxidoreductase